MYVFVLDKNKQPLDPTHPAKARKLLKSGRAKVFKRYPFTIIIQDLLLENCKVKEHQLKIDPGSKTTGLALLQNNKVIWAAELHHRGFQIKEALLKRRSLRISRRSRKTRYRKARFFNRTKPKGWLPPSLMSRVYNIMTWVKRLRKLCNLTKLSQELVKFDTQKLQNPEVTGKEYQQGTLFQYECREYLLEKFNRTCVYCNAKEIPLEVEHIIPKSKGGSNRISNLTLACRPCNQSKGSQDVKDFLNGEPDLLKRILSQVKASLKDAAAVNSTRNKLYEELKSIGLEVETGTGGLTKFNRTNLGLEKTHWLDAACVGKSTPNNLKIKVNNVLIIRAKGHGNRQMVSVDKYGFPRKNYKAKNPPREWKTGDIVNVVNGKYKGLKGVRLAGVRAKGNFPIKSKDKQIEVSRKHIKIVFHKDGYDYGFDKCILSLK
jgi:5-methylcytosine-specific restriction endonuclease McrA